MMSNWSFDKFRLIHCTPNCTPRVVQGGKNSPLQSLVLRIAYGKSLAVQALPKRANFD